MRAPLHRAGDEGLGQAELGAVSLKPRVAKPVAQGLAYATGQVSATHLCVDMSL